MRRVAFDGAILAAGPWLGVARSFLVALRAYAASPGTRPLLLLPPATPTVGIDGVEEMRTRAVCGPLARRLLLPGLLRRVGVAVWHAPIAAIPKHRDYRVIATVHDVPWQARDLPREEGHGWRHRRALLHAARHADVVLCPSQATAADLRTEVSEVRARLLVVPHGVSLPERVLPIAEHDGPFVSLGDDRPRKNLARLREAHARARARHPGLRPLVLFGPRRDGRGITPQESEKHEALSRARALVHPSLHEGFGLPVLEAMGHGTPVICSDRKSLPELAGGAALLVDPTDVDAIAEALIAIDSDSALCEKLARAGRARAAAFQPEQVAAAWRRIHEELGA
ncbi:MAG: glycosyltransferase [Planctomycetota bacterium]